MPSLYERTILISGVGLDSGVFVGKGVLVFVGCKVSVGWTVIAVGFAHPNKKSAYARKPETLTTIRCEGNFLFNWSAPLRGPFAFLILSFYLPTPRSWIQEPAPRPPPRAR